MRRIHLTKNKHSIVDAEYHDTLIQMGQWCYQSPGYAATRTAGSLILMHRVVCELVYGPSPLNVDHINGDKLDNRSANLRYATQSDNCMNMLPRSDNTSGFRGVFWHRAASKWMAQVKYRHQTYYLGLFDDKRAAAAAYNNKVMELCPDYAVLNVL